MHVYFQIDFTMFGGILFVFLLVLFCFGILCAIIRNKVSTTIALTLVLLVANFGNTGELGYDRPLYDGFLHMTDDMLGPSPMHIKYSSYVYDGFCI